MTDLSKGILFEDTGSFLEWGKPIDNLISKFGEKKMNRGDRTVYYWGKHSILNGLELELMNSFWNFGVELKNRYFNSIEFWALGDNLAQDYFNKISNHLTLQFGIPTTKEDYFETERERLWIWKLIGIEIQLLFFEQHAYKLNFIIKNK